MTKQHLPKGSTAEGPWSLRITPEQAGWAFCGLQVLELGPGDAHSFASGTDELLVLPLEGACVVECESRRFELAGRDGVFTAVSDFAYAPRDAEVRVSSAGGGRFILPSALAGARQPSAKARTKACAASVPAAAGVLELIAFSFLLMSLQMPGLSARADQRSRMKTVVATSPPRAAPARVWAGV